MKVKNLRNTRRKIEIGKEGVPSTRGEGDTSIDFGNVNHKDVLEVDETHPAELVHCEILPVRIQDV